MDCMERRHNEDKITTAIGFAGRNRRTGGAVVYVAVVLYITKRLGNKDCDACDTRENETFVRLAGGQERVVRRGWI